MSSILSHSIPSLPIQSNSIEDYLAKRYSIPVDKKHNDIGLNVEIRVLSALLTYPTSLSFGLLSCFSEENAIPIDKSDVSVLVVGARAEASLPRVWWAEAVHSLVAPAPALRTGPPSQLSVNMVGPHLPGGLSAGPPDGPLLDPRGAYTYHWLAAAAEESGAASREGLPARFGSIRVSDVSRGRSTVHAHPSAARLLAEHDAFVLYNPGYGSPALRDQWRDTLLALLRTGKPLVCTAHCAFDMQRDLRQLHTLVDGLNAASSVAPSSGGPRHRLQWLLPARPNPFASLRRALDLGEDPAARITTTNQFVTVFRLLQDPQSSS